MSIEIKKDKNETPDAPFVSHAYVKNSNTSRTIKVTAHYVIKIPGEKTTEGDKPVEIPPGAEKELGIAEARVHSGTETIDWSIKSAEYK